MTAVGPFRFVIQIQTLVSITRKPLAYLADARPIRLAYDSLPEPLHATYGMLSLGRSQRLRLSVQQRTENQRRARRSAAVRALATLSQRWSVVTHSNMRTVVLCRNFSGASRLVFQNREIRMGQSQPSRRR